MATLFLFFAMKLAAVGDEVTAQSIRKVLAPYLKTLEVDEEVLAKEKAKIELGRMLFYDSRISGDASLSCNSCHDLNHYGTNGEAFLNRAKRGEFHRDVPSIYNLNELSVYDWVGDTKSLNAKIRSAFQSEHEMNITDTTDIINKLQAIDGYHEPFEKAFPETEEPINLDNISKAIELFVSQLITPAPIDAFLSGDDSALTEKQLQGAYHFDERYCFSCHTGSNFGGQMIIKLGIKEPWPNQEDQGLYEVSKKDIHRMHFRVSPLRNVAKTDSH